MRPTSRIACVLLLVILLTSCGTSSSQVTPTPLATPTMHSTITDAPTVEATAQEVVFEAYPVANPALPPTVHPDFGYPPDFTPHRPLPTYTPLPTDTPTITPTPGPPTITPIVGGPTSTPSANHCSFGDLRSEVRTYPLPDLSNTHWEPVEREGLKGMRLVGISAEIEQADASPYGTGVAVPSPKRVFSGPGGWDFSLIVVGGPSQQPWVAVESYNEYYYPYQWLPDNRIIWADQGKLYTAKADGSEKVQIPVPDEVIEVWANGKYAIASGEFFWRINLTSRISQKIEGIGGFSQEYYNARLTPDQSELLVNHYGTLLQMPLAPSGPVIQYKTLNVLGSEGRVKLPFAVGRNYLHPGEVSITENDKYELVLFQRGNPEPIPLYTLIPVGDEYRLSDIRTSMDERWIYADVYENDPNKSIYMQGQVGIYVASADDIANGKIIPGNYYVTEWRSDPPAVFLASRERITEVSLPSFQMKEIANIELWESHARNNITLFQGDGFFALFSPDGLMISLHNLEKGNRPERVFLGYNSELLITGNQFWSKGNACHVTSWLDVLQLP